jgi:hypothetical protein
MFFLATLCSREPVRTGFRRSNKTSWSETTYGAQGGSVKCQNSNLHQLFQLGYVLEFGEHSTKQPHTKFQTQILMYGKAAAL